MFSGLKSILFGYSDPVEPANPSTSETAQNGGTTIGISSNSSLSTDTSALLEQTLNAATTKFTEQLLPNSPSIEQLQSSSHQLLPTLNEQHEELEKEKSGKQVEELKKDEKNIEDDDECFIADSWELLDLVESKPEQRVSATSAVQDKNLKISTIDNNTTKTSGILKQTKTRNNEQLSPPGSEEAKQEKKSNQRQKPKVSFDTPDLVIEKQKIDPITSKDESSVKTKKGKSKNKRKQVNKLAATTSFNDIEGSVDGQKNEEAEPLVEAKFEVISNTEQSEVEEQSAKAPVLNYAAVLTMKLKKNENEVSGRKLVGESFTNLKESLNAGKTSDAEEKKLQASGAVKRNRPMSTSSWSSSDEIEAIDLMWKEVESKVEAKVVEENSGICSALDPAVDYDNEENESVISSGFSDCDYGYHGLNDFFMRHKKGQNKRRGVSATSSGLLNSMAKRGAERLPSSDSTTSKKLMETSTCRQQQEQKASTLEVRGKWNSVAASTYLLKQTRAKKKKLTLTGPTPSTSTKSANHTKKSPIVSSSSRNNFVMPKSGVHLESANAFLKPSLPLSNPSLQNNNNLVASSVSGNDSSDVAEMDESWYVTPPPCFTGSNKLNKPKPAKAKEAARENALIEHPSIYIAETSRQKLEDETTCASAFKLVEVPTAKLQPNEGNKKSTKKSQKASVVLKNETKWKRKNKFVVTAWTGDEQNNMNDDVFDDIFDTPEPILAKKSLKKKNINKKESNQLKKVQSRQAIISKNDGRIESPLFDDLLTGYESDFSIPSPALVGLTDDTTNTDTSIEMVSDASAEASSEALDVATVEIEEKEQDENKELSLEEKAVCVGIVDLKRRRAKSVSEKKAPVVVEPILPERQPGWQLKKKRNKRRPLVVGSSNNGKTSPRGAADQMASADNSGSSSARSSPNLIDRIGQSIVANLTNLTSGFSGNAQQTMPLQPRAVIEEVEKLNQSVAKKTTADSNMGTRRRMSKSYLDRQNGCAKVANSTRRADRRLKMRSTPNGISVNRKVHTNVH